MTHHLAASPVPQTYRYVIAGAGCAGLSLIWYLLERGVSSPIVLLDRRTEFSDDRTWCFWDTEPTPFSHLACAKWFAWSVRAGGQETVRGAPATPYLCVRGGDFHRFVLNKIAEHPNVKIICGIHVSGWEETPNGVRVCTSGGDFCGDVFINAQGPQGLCAPCKKSEKSAGFNQIFAGHFVCTNRPVFNPAQITLMDWNAEPLAGGLRFAYVLPFSTHRALVEITAFVPRSQPAPALTDLSHAVAPYIAARFGETDFAVEKTESGTIPMTSQVLPQQTGGRIFHVGAAGGATRPSSGYTFLRTQRTTRALADILVSAKSGNGQITPAPLDSSRRRFLDRVFLQVMQDCPDQIPGIFHGLFARVPPPVLVRFLSDQSSVSDEACLLRGLPFAPFLRAAKTVLVS